MLFKLNCNIYPSLKENKLIDMYILKKHEYLSVSICTNSISVSFFLPLKMKSAREAKFCTFLWLSRVENIFLAHFFSKFLGQFRFFSGTFSDFSGVIFFLLAEIWEFFEFSLVKICIFVGQRIFFSGGIFCFFLGQFFFFSENV